MKKEPKQQSSCLPLVSNNLLDAPQIGEIRFDSLGKVRVMGIIEGWVMYRRKRCNPAIETVNNFNQRYKKESV